MVLVAVNLAIALVVVSHYGQSTDERNNIEFARQTLLSYAHPEQPYLDPLREDKGPFYLMLWFGVGEWLGRTVPPWELVDGRHFVNFLAFQLAVISIYALSVKLVPPLPALAATLLFETQPLFWGHAFINQKDSPFMALFAASVALGLAMADRLGQPPSEGPPARGEGRRPAFRLIAAEAWRRDPARGFKAVALFFVLALVVPTTRILLEGPIRAATDRLVRSAYRGEAWTPINQVFRRLAENAAAVDPAAYVQRTDRLVDLGTLLLSVVMLVVAASIVWRTWTGSRGIGRAFVRDLWEGIATPLPRILFPAAMVLGMTIAVRSVGLYAGLLAVGYAVARGGPRVIVPLAIYVGAAGLVAILLWPQLWLDPAAMFAGSLSRTLQFPGVHQTLFEGVALASDDLPRWYLPELMAIQYTLPGIFFILIGLWVAVRRVRRCDPKTGRLAVLLLWLLAPFLAAVVFRSPIYNYTRQVLFMMPPLFVLTALSIDPVLRAVRAKGAAAAMVAVLIAPGVWAIANLHPYEYGYFNELVGGVRGAYGRFMSDYWCTSFREAMRYVNDVAPPSARVAVSGAEGSAVPFARGDLVLKDESEIELDPSFRPVLVLACNWATVDPDFFPQAPVLYAVERAGVPLAVVKQLGPLE